MKQFGYKSVMEVPRIEKITLNMGVGEAVADKRFWNTPLATCRRSPVKTGGDHCPQVDRRLQDS